MALHVTNGDSAVPGLRGTGLVERVLVWRDVLHEGPVPPLRGDELRRVRAAFLMEADGRGEHADALRDLSERDALLDANRDGEFMLWFEADLYDQLQLIQILSRLAELGVTAERITLICIGEHPGVARFGGLGELDAGQLRELPARAGARLSPAALEPATRAWDAFRAPQPDDLAVIAATPSSELRFLGEAFDRMGREYPSTRDGLSLTERRVLAAVAAGAPTAGAAFIRAAAREARPFLGDLWCFRIITRLAHPPKPLLELGGSPARVAPDTPLRITAAGRRALGGAADHVAMNGVDRWIGGVHLTGHEVRWRWDDGTETIVDTRGTAEMHVAARAASGRATPR